MLLGADVPRSALRRRDRSGAGHVNRSVQPSVAQRGRSFLATCDVDREAAVEAAEATEGVCSAQAGWQQRPRRAMGIRGGN